MNTELQEFFLGWGQTEFTGPKSDVLQKVSLQVTDIDYCASMHPTMLINFNQICTYAPGKDTCQSDSGGKQTIFNSKISYYVH